MNTNSESVARATALSKIYRRGAEAVTALDGFTYDFAPGVFYCVLGPSGAGKTTLLNLLGAMDVPTGGDLEVAGQNVARGGKVLRGPHRRPPLSFPKLRAV